jgi:hypothetical protein
MRPSDLCFCFHALSARQAASWAISVSRAANSLRISTGSDLIRCAAGNANIGFRISALLLRSMFFSPLLAIKMNLYYHFAPRANDQHGAL